MPATTDLLYRLLALAVSRHDHVAEVYLWQRIHAAGAAERRLARRIAA